MPLKKLNTLNLHLLLNSWNLRRHFSTVLIKIYWYTVSCKYESCTGLEEVRSLISKPFAINDNVFTVFAENGNDEKFTSATLYVPKGTKSLYQQTDRRKNFQNIVEMGDGPEPGKKVERRTVVEEGTGTWCGYCPPASTW